MVEIIRKFFAFCSEENRRKFQTSVLLGVFQAMFEALKIPAIAVMVKALLAGQVTGRDILLSLGIMVLSIAGAGLIKAKASMLQTEGGYDTCAKKRIEIAEHMRYLPMGYFSDNSLGQITSVTTNVLENLENVATRVVMLVCEGLLTTALIIVMLAFFDLRISLVLLIGLCLFLAANTSLQKAAGTLAPRKINADEKLVEKVLEYLQGMAEVKAYHLTGKKSAELNEAIATNSKVNTDMEMTLIPRMSAQLLIAKLTGVAMALCACIFYCNGTMDALTAVVMVISAFIVNASLETAGNYSALLRIVDASVDRVQEILKRHRWISTVRRSHRKTGISKRIISNSPMTGGRSSTVSVFPFRKRVSPQLSVPPAAERLPSLICWHASGMSTRERYPSAAAMSETMIWTP